jgi:diketogulonate reductase-like aldo/keto reductase
VRQQKFGGGPDVSVIGQGTWYIDRGDRAAATAGLRRGLDLGMTHIDTAEMYDDA